MTISHSSILPSTQKLHQAVTTPLTVSFGIRRLEVPDSLAWRSVPPFFFFKVFFDFAKPAQSGGGGNGMDICRRRRILL